jgi:hypothetical protein
MGGGAGSGGGCMAGAARERAIAQFFLKNEMITCPYIYNPYMICFPSKTRRGVHIDLDFSISSKTTLFHKQTQSYFLNKTLFYFSSFYPSLPSAPDSHSWKGIEGVRRPRPSAGVPPCPRVGGG